MQVKGTITNIRKENKVSKAGKPFTLSYLTVDSFGEEINVGWEKGHTVGDPFDKNIEKDKWNQWKPMAAGGGQVVSAGSSPRPAPSSGGRGSIKYPVPADDGQNVIINQNSMAHATAIAIATMPEGASSRDVLEVALTLAPQITSFASGRSTLDKVTKMLAEQEVA